jgi:hypothetical protein
MHYRIIAATMLLRSCVVANGFSAPTLPPSTVSGQPQPRQPEPEAQNAVYLEGGGPSVFFAVNYDRRFSGFAGRFGLGYLHWSSSRSDVAGTGGSSKSILSVPLSISYLGSRLRSHMFEAGLGASVYFEKDTYAPNLDRTYLGRTQTDLYLLPNFFLGYRLQPPAGGFVLRTGLSLLVSTDERAFYRLPLVPWPYLAMGGACD